MNKNNIFNFGLNTRVTPATPSNQTTLVNLPTRSIRRTVNRPIRSIRRTVNQPTSLISLDGLYSTGRISHLHQELCHKNF